MLLRTLLVAIAALAPALAHAGTPAEIAARATSAVSSPKWQRIEVQRATPDDYALVVWYKRMPDNFAEVERDTKTIGRAMLKELQAVKRLPSEQELHLVVRARMPEVGETGKSLVRVFGVSRYFASHDQFTFERNK